jgi:hypothetical protein
MFSFQINNKLETWVVLTAVLVDRHEEHRHPAVELNLPRFIHLESFCFHKKRMLFIFYLFLTEILCEK